MRVTVPSEKTEETKGTEFKTKKRRERRPEEAVLLRRPLAPRVAQLGGSEVRIHKQI
jgi:hypothetical protein